MEYTNQVVLYYTDRYTFGMVKKYTEWFSGWPSLSDTFKEKRVLVRNLATGDLHNRALSNVTLTGFNPIIDIE